MNTWRIQIRGVVQGVGFRPFVHHVATSLNLKGQVLNNLHGVQVDFNADSDQAQSFYQQLILDAPPLSSITDHSLRELEAKKFKDFSIASSEKSKLSNFRITPDLAMCDACKDEIHDPQNRRFGYSFTTCTLCGPRFSILTGLPFDRRRTTMASFEMCISCQQEYDDPKDRRHHSQTNSCVQCGIALKLFDCKAKNFILNQRSDEELVATISDRLLNGAIIAVKGVGGFLLLCDASNEKALVELRKRKERPGKPFALMYPSINVVLQDYMVSPQESQALRSPEAPIVLLRAKPDPGHRIQTTLINPGLDHVGVMLPYAPLYELILQQVKLPIVATSGNISQSPIIHDNDTAVDQLSNIADYILIHNRDITFPQDDSVVQFTKNTQQRVILRRGRGLAPNYINPGLEIPDTTTMIGIGADLKNSFSVVHRQNIFVSSYLGDMGHYQVQENEKKGIEGIKRLLDKPLDQVIVDKHPNYYSRQLGIDLAEQNKTPLIEVQHHVSHFCAIMGEHNLLTSQNPVLGVIWDGNGYGDDTHIWGSEYFIFHQNAFSRVSHINYFDAIAGDKMSREPRLSALAIGFGNALETLKQKFSLEEWRIYTKQLSAGDGLKSCSMGRLFDAVASILGVTDINTFEAEAALRLQSLVADFFYSRGLTATESYEVFDEQSRLDAGKLMHEMSVDLVSGKQRIEIAAKFYQTLVHWIELVAAAHQVKKIAFSGGVFQNSVLVDLIMEQLGPKLELFFHQDFSPNDENISFGQVVYASLPGNPELQV